MKREVNMRASVKNKTGKRDSDEKTPSSQEKGNIKQQSQIITDPLGSWTGVPVDPYFNEPIQDADDL